MVNTDTDVAMVSRLVNSNVRTESNMDQYWSIFRHVTQDHQVPSEVTNNIRFEKFLGFVTGPQGAISSSAYSNHYKEGMLSSASGSSLGLRYANSVYYTTVVVEEDDMKDLTEDDVWGSHYTSSAAMEDSYSLDRQEEAAKFCHDNSFIIKKLSSDPIQRDVVSDEDEDEDDDDDDVLVTSTTVSNHVSNGHLVSTMNMVGNMNNEEKITIISHGVNTTMMNKDPYIHGQLVPTHDSSSYSFITALDQEQVMCGDTITQFTSSPDHVNDGDNENCLSITSVADSSTPVTVSHGMLFNGPRSVPMDIVDPKVIWSKTCDDDDDDDDGGDDDETMTKASSIGTDKNEGEGVENRSYNGYGCGSNIRVVPPHELLAKQGAKNGHASMTFSVTEGAGRTLKGREICKVRDAVWKQTGFPG